MDRQKLDAYIQLLTEYISFQSISTDAAYKPQIAATVNWLSKLFQTNGFAVKTLQGPVTNPVVLAEYNVSPDAETILVYGHYDVQPASIEEGWIKDPFQLHEKDGRLIARGVVDNKGQNLTHIFTVINLIKAGKLQYNVKFMIEGNEETSNPDIEGLIAAHAKELKADHILISDGEIIRDIPTVEASLRGGGNITLTFTSAKNDLHSGLYGGVAPSSLMELVHFLSKIKDPKTGEVLIPGFYDDVDPIDPEQEKTNIALQERTKPLASTGTKTLIGKYDFYTQKGLRPTIEITGIGAGYMGEGYRNAIPGSSSAKINFRLVSSQKTRHITEILNKFLADNVPAYIEYKFSGGDFGPAVKVDTNTPMARRIMGIQEKVYGKTPVVTSCGAGIPIVSDFKEILGADALLISLGNEDCNMHGVDENYTLDLAEKGLNFSEQFFRAI